MEESRIQPFYLPNNLARFTVDGQKRNDRWRAITLSRRSFEVSRVRSVVLSPFTRTTHVARQLSKYHERATRPDSPAASQVHESARPEASVRSLRNDRWQDSSWNDKKERERERKKKERTSNHVWGISPKCLLFELFYFVSFFLSEFIYMYIFGAAEWNEIRVVKKWIEVVFCGDT